METTQSLLFVLSASRLTTRQVNYASFVPFFCSSLPLCSALICHFISLNARCLDLSGATSTAHLLCGFRRATKQVRDQATTSRPATLKQCLCKLVLLASQRLASGSQRVSNKCRCSTCCSLAPPRATFFKWPTRSSS